MKFECRIGCDTAPERVATVEDVCRGLTAIITELLRPDVRVSKEGENNVFVTQLNRDGYPAVERAYVGWYAFGDFVDAGKRKSEELLLDAICTAMDGADAHGGVEDLLRAASALRAARKEKR